MERRIMGMKLMHPRPTASLKLFFLLFTWQGICLTWAPASSSSWTHWACPRTQASCRGVMESTATTLTEAPPWMRLWSWEAWPSDAALCTSVLSDQQPAEEQSTQLYHLLLFSQTFFHSYTATCCYFLAQHKCWFSLLRSGFCSWSFETSNQPSFTN